MGCGPAQPEAPSGDKNTLHIYGDYFNTETRALLIICKMANIEHQFHLIDTLEKQNESAEYLRKNPNGSIPMLEKDGNVHITSGKEVLEFVLRTNPEKIAQAFEADQESNKFKAMRRYFFQEFRIKSSKLIRRAANLKLNPENSRANPDDKGVTMAMTALEEHIYKELNKGELNRSDFLTGPKMSVLDVLYFCEIHQITSHYSREIPKYHNKLANWFDEMIKIDTIKDINAAFNAVLNDHNLRVNYNELTQQ